MNVMYLPQLNFVLSLTIFSRSMAVFRDLPEELVVEILPWLFRNEIVFLSLSLSLFITNYKPSLG